MLEVVQYEQQPLCRYVIGQADRDRPCPDLPDAKRGGNRGEEALRIRDAKGGEVVVVCLGPDRAQSAIRNALAMGADSALHLKDPLFEGCDPLGVARALIKRPDYAIFNRPLSGLDLRQQEEIAQRVVEAARDGERPFSVIWVASSAQMAKIFDRVLVFEHGAIVEDGAPQKLIDDNGAYAKLVA